MSIITFTSDFGTSDHYVAAVKAKIYSYNADINVVDITHNVEHFNIAHGAYALNAVFRDFPQETVHLVAVNSHGHKNDKFIAAKFEGHFFVGCDNGLFSLLSEEYAEVVNLNQPEESFPEKHIFAHAAAVLAVEKSLESLGEIRQQELKRLVDREPKLTKDQITGNVIHADGYGNLITNISAAAFHKIIGNGSFEINFGRNRITQIDNTYNRQDEGDCVILFNNQGMMEIAINKGNAAQLLGLGYDSTITIQRLPERTG